eukprot:4026415-Pyramimonas_sp.AAC.1
MPVLFQPKCGKPCVVPVLDKPRPFSTTRPYGPTNVAPSWGITEAALGFLGQVIAQESDIEARLLALNPTCQQFASDMAKPISIRTDTPIKSPTMPGVGLPKIRWVPGAAREVEPRANWRSLSIPVRWLKNKVMDDIRKVHSREEFYMSEILVSIQSPPPEPEGAEEFARLRAS